MKNDKGVTLLIISIAVIVMIAITSMLIYGAKNQISTKNLNNLYNDIESINTKISAYYLQNGSLPIFEENAYINKQNLIYLLQTKGVTSEPLLNPNDDDNYYVINLNRLDNLTLNYGQQYLKWRNNPALDFNETEDVYIINKVTHQIYYPQGVKVDGKFYYMKDMVGQVDAIEFSKIENTNIEISVTNDQNENLLETETLYTTKKDETIRINTNVSIILNNQNQEFKIASVKYAWAQENIPPEQGDYTEFTLNSSNNAKITSKELGKGVYYLWIKITDNYANEYIKTTKLITINEKWHYNDDGNLTDGFKIIKIGDYIDYNEQIEETKEIEGKTIYTSEASQNGYEEQVFKLNSYTYGWRVLGVDETTGELLLLAEDFVCPSTGGYTEDSTGRTYYCLKGRDGYANGIDELNKICSLYGQGKYSTGARSITAEDVNKVTGYNPETEKYAAGNIWEYGNKVTYYWDGTVYPYYEVLGKPDLSGKLVHGHNSFDWYDEESKDWKTSLRASSAEASTDNKKEITTLESNCYIYAGSSYINSTSEGYKMLFTDSATGANASNVGSTSGFYYWLASRWVMPNADFVVYGMRRVDNGNLRNPFLFFSHAGNSATQDYYNGVRPVVSIQSDTKVNTEGKDGTSSLPYTLSQ